MNKRLFSSLSILAFAFALVLGFGAINYSSANDLMEEAYPGPASLFGDDQAHNSAGPLGFDRDAAPRPEIDSHGLQGNRVSTF